MKPEELMIGDFVTFKDCQNEEEILVIKIWQLNQDGNALVFIDDSKVLDEIAIDDEIVGISLTSEILEKNEFRKSISPPGIHAKCYEFENKEEKYLLTIANYNKYKRLLLNVDSEDSECFNIKCDYVHELQHALKLCRIEKTIEL